MTADGSVKTIRVMVTVDTDELREWAGRHADAGRHGVAHALYEAANRYEAMAATDAEPEVACTAAEEAGERIARAIEEKYLGPDSGRGYDGREAPDAHCRNAYDEGLETAASIARGGTQ